MCPGSENTPSRPVTSTVTPVSSLVSRMAHPLGVSPNSIFPIGSAHWPVSRRLCTSTRPCSSTASTPHAGTREFGAGALGSFQYSTRLMQPPSVQAVPQPGDGGAPHPVKRGHVVAGQRSPIKAPQVEGRVRRRGLAIDVRVYHDLIVVAEQRRIQGGAVQPHLTSLHLGQRPVVGQR